MISEYSLCLVKWLRSSAAWFLEFELMFRDLCDSLVGIRIESQVPSVVREHGSPSGSAHHDIVLYIHIPGRGSRMWRPRVGLAEIPHCRFSRCAASHPRLRASVPSANPPGDGSSCRTFPTSHISESAAELRPATHPLHRSLCSATSLRLPHYQPAERQASSPCLDCCGATVGWGVMSSWPHHPVGTTAAWG